MITTGFMQKECVAVWLPHVHAAAIAWPRSKVYSQHNLQSVRSNVRHLVAHTKLASAQLLLTAREAGAVAGGVDAYHHAPTT